MTQYSIHRSASTLAVLAFLSACGGGTSTGTTTDATAPTVSISDDVPGANASGNVTFTFAFDETVTGFTVDDVTVTGGTKGQFNMASTGKSATLVVTPSTNTSSTINVQVGVASFADTSGNANKVGATASQAYDTTTSSPDKAITGFEENAPPAITAIGGATATVESNPAGQTGKGLKITRMGGKDWAGAWIAISPLPTNAGSQQVSAKVNSPKAGIKIALKAEYGDNVGTGEVPANETVVLGWQTLTWNFTTFVSGQTYNRLVFLPNVTVVDVAETSYYFDDISYKSISVPPSDDPGGDATAVMGGAGAQALPIASATDQHGFILAGEAVFAADYKGKLDANNNHAGWERAATNYKGNIGFFQDPLIDTSSQTVEQNGWIASNIDNPGGVGNFFRYVLLKGSASTFSNSYMGLYANAPNNGTVDVSTYGNIKFKLWGPAEQYQQSNLSPVLKITLAGPKVVGCTTDSGGTELEKTLTANQKIGAGSNYVVSLAGWSVKGLCGTDTNATAANAVMSKLARFVVTIPGSSFNFTNATADKSSFPTGVNLGPIAFTK